MPDLARPAQDGFKVFGEHIAGCFCDRPDYERAFIVPLEPIYNLRRNGTRGGSTMWFRFRCNDTKCPAVVGVRWDVLGDFIDQGLGRTT